MNKRTKFVVQITGMFLFLALILTALSPTLHARGASTTVYIDNLQPSWDALGGGGVFSAYIGPAAYTYASPGSTALYDGREAGIIKAGINPDPDDGQYWDEGLLAFKVPNIDLTIFAGQVLTYDVENESGTNPVWVRIRLTNGSQYQFVPASYGVGGGYHTIDAAAGSWYLMDSNGNATGSPKTLAEVASDNPGVAVDRVYLTLGMGNSYNVAPGVGTVGWVDKVVIGEVTYDFVLARFWYVSTTGSDSNEGTEISPFLTIQHAITAAAPGDTIHVAAGTYDGTINIDTRTNISIVGADMATTIVKSSTTLPFNVGGYGSSRKAVIRVVNSTGIAISGLTFDLDLVKGNGIYAGLYWDSTGTITGNTFKNNQISDASGGYTEIGLYLRATGFTDVSRAAISLTGNTFQDLGRVALLIHDYVNATITGNTFSKTVDDFGYGIELGSASTGTITGNTFHGFDTPALSDSSSSAGLYLENSFTWTVIDPAISKTVTINNNEFYANQYGLHIGNEFDGYAGNVDILASITGNNFHDNTDGAVVIADEDKEAGSSVTANFTNNTVVNNGESGFYLYTFGDGDLTVNIQGGSITGHDYGVYLNDYASGPSTSSYDVTVENAQITGNTTNAVLNDYSGTTLDASPDWWGSAAGPAAGQLDGLVTFTPWCAVADCSVLNPQAGQIILPSGVTAAEIQTAINNAPEGTTIVIPAGTYTFTGGYHVDTNHLTILLLDGAIIQNNSPCFTVNASYTRVTTESIGGAKCVPTGGSNGIDVAADLTNVIIEGLEIDGGVLFTGDGIHFAGAINDVQVINNKVHDLDGNGLTFVTAPTGVVDVQGNLFMDNMGVGVSAPSDLNVAFNSWGDYGGPTTGDGISGSITSYTPWTHVELYMTSSGTPWGNNVMNGHQIIYTVYGYLQSVKGAEFTLNIPAGLSYVSSAAKGVFENETLTPGTGTLTFQGFELLAAANSGANVALFDVTLQGAATGYGDLVLNTADFTMAPGYGPSNNIYPAALVDGTVTVFAAPVLSSLDFGGTYYTANPQEFTLTITNPIDGMAFATPQLWFGVSGATLEYWYGTDWVAVSGGVQDIPALAVNTSVSLLFRLNFFAPVDGDAVVTLMDNGVIPAEPLASLTQHITAYTSSTVTGTFSMQGRSIRAGIPVTLNILIPPGLYGPYDNTTVELITGNLTISNVADGTYIIATNQARYLNLTIPLWKTKVVSGDTTLAALELKGGNAVWTDNEIDVLDASQVGSDWGGGITLNGDVNFSGKVDIFDLALVGGNYSLTSATAYASWTP
jgi:hypothetical protein